MDSLQQEKERRQKFVPRLADWPHAPRDCIAHAWSVAEIARAYVEDLLEVDLRKSD
jgi:glycogen debranching enzyme